MTLTAYPTLRLKLTMPQALKMQFLPAVPGSDAAASAAAAAASAAEAAALVGGAPDENITTLVDGATISVDATAGNIFHITASGDRTLLAPSNAPAVGRGQRMIIRHQASGGNRLLTLTTGSAGAFRYGSTITGLTTTISGTTDYIGCLWNDLASRWDVVAYCKGL